MEKNGAKNGVFVIYYGIRITKEEHGMTEMKLSARPRRERCEFFKGMGWPFWSLDLPADVAGLPEAL